MKTHHNNKTLYETGKQDKNLLLREVETMVTLCNSPAQSRVLEKTALHAQRVRESTQFNTPSNNHSDKTLSTERVRKMRGIPQIETNERAVSG